MIVGQPNRFPNTPHACAAIGDSLSITTSCSTADYNSIDVSGSTVDDFGDFRDAVECSSQGGGSKQFTSSSSMTGTAQDSDGDGIPDSSDRCTHNSN